jgi:hypothetical protein
MGEDRAGLELIAQTARKLIDDFARFEKEPGSAKHISDVVIACHEARARLRVMVENDQINGHPRRRGVRGCPPSHHRAGMWGVVRFR